MHVICYGDSNTYGFDPRSWLGGRYPASDRWTDILAAQAGWTVCKEGINGREIPSGLVRFSVVPDMLIVMLGTNDLLQGCTAQQAADRMGGFLRSLTMEKSRILLIAPPPMQFGEWVAKQRLIDESIRLADTYKTLASGLDVRFLNAGKWGVSLAYDGVHFTEQGHKAFADGLLAELALYNPSVPGYDNQK